MLPVTHFVKQTIYILELGPTLVMKWVWGLFLEGAPVWWFLKGQTKETKRTPSDWGISRNPTHPFSWFLV